MRMITDKKAVSAFILVILLLCSVVFGAFISYMWVMANFYLEPEKSVDLVITEANFTVDHAEYFYVTVMNPTHSVSSTNITNIYFSVEGENETFNVVTYTDPELPIPIERGTIKNIKCLANWGNFAGKTITIYIYALNSSGAVHSTETPFEKLEVQPYYNATISIEYFNLTVKNDPLSAINLTLSNAYLDYEPITKIYDPVAKANITLPRKISINETINFQCFTKWEGHRRPLVRVETLEGYIVEITQNTSSVVVLQATNVTFNEANPSELNITFSNTADSATLVDITDIFIKYDNTTAYINGSMTNPSLPRELKINSTVTFECVWPWGDHRNTTITIGAHTKQGFVSLSKTVKTPQSIIPKIEGLSFNLANTGYFLANVTNMPSSLHDATITNATIVYGTKTIRINQTVPGFPYNISVGDTQTFNCTFDWSSYKGGTITVNFYASTYNANYTFTLPIVNLNATFNGNVSMHYFSISIQNSAFSNVTVTGINVNGTLMNSTFTYPSLPVTVENGKTLLIICPLDWQPLSGQEITIIVTTSNGFELTTKVRVP